MAETPSAEIPPDEKPGIELESGTYEIIRNRLNSHAAELRARLEKLNAARKAVFGSIDTELLGTERLSTENNCTPRDMVAVGSHFLFGYNVVLGLRPQTRLSDVFAVYEFSDGAFRAAPLDLIRQERFERDFKEIYKYYRGALFAKFFLAEPHLYMVFRIGKTVDDIKTFKWLIRDDKLEYVDNRSDHEVRFPPQHDFEWLRTTRDQHRPGRHPHVSIHDRVFVEAVGGDLTVKIENNTQSGEGIYAEPVDDPDQTLDDAEIYYAVVGNIILLKIRPYQETRFRYLVYNEKLQRCVRLDAIEHACVQLPDDHGLIFSNGYYLQGGQYKTFESDLGGMLFDRRIASPNGEDFLYVFYNRQTGTYVLLQYNLIEQRIDTPLVCNGYTLFSGGDLICFKSQDEPQKHHAVQIWRSPYTAEPFAPEAQRDSFLFKVGNKDVVRGMAECHEILALIAREEVYANLYVDLVKAAGDTIDAYFWLDREETFQLKEVLLRIREAAAAAVDEFDKVVRVKRNTAQAAAEAKNRTREIVQSIGRQRFAQIGDFVASLADLRAVRGEIISLGNLRYVDETEVARLDAEVSEQSDRLAARCVEFLLRDDSLRPYQQKVEALRGGIPDLQTVSQARQVEEEIAAAAGELEMLIEIVSNLKIDDATQRTAIIDGISAIFAGVNAARAAVKNRSAELLSVEGTAEFNSQMKLLNQGVVNYLDVCDTPARCEEFLTKVMIQIEELDGRFAQFDEFVVQLAEKREEIYNAFETRKVALVEAHNKRASSLMRAAERILAGIKVRVDAMQSINEINGYFAADLMIEKVRDIVAQLRDLDDTVKVDDIQSRLKTVKEDAVRQLKDRQELFVGGENVIKLGNHHFSVNVQALDLTTVLRDGRMFLHLTGTNFFETLDDPRLLQTAEVWDQEILSENRDVYRAEYLAYLMFSAWNDTPGDEANRFLAAEEKDRIALVQQFMGPRYGESYVKGVHDHDAARILAALLEIRGSIGLLRFHARARALARVFWNNFGEKKEKTAIAARLQGAGSIHSLFPQCNDRGRHVTQLAEMLRRFVDQDGLFDASFVGEAAEYLFCELIGQRRFAVGRPAADLFENFHQALRQKGAAERFQTSLDALSRDAAGRFALCRDWVTAWLPHGQRDEKTDYLDETAALLLEGKFDPGDVVEGRVAQDLQRMAGNHPLLERGQYRLHYNRFIRRLADFRGRVVLRFENYTRLKRELVDAAREEIRLDEFRPRVLTSFVRNKLIDTVYLPLVGDNLAKQIGVVGEAKRTDLMGLLLLVSPPGYGKTTLMEYLANRLGLIFMKVNGPAIGHRVGSLDPAEAPNAAAREEIAKLNLALEMGDNVMLYVDDVQHCNPEFLQKFISLCDAQRKIEGVYKGKTRTYDLRGRKVVVVMAGNPYTESGEMFKIPDMLSNRADVYNLGEIIGDTAEVFEMSYLENALTSNPVLSKLATRSRADVYAIIRLAQRGPDDGVELEGNYSVEELEEFVSVMKKLMRVRDVVLAVNREYIRSAAQGDEYRTEPPFKLQGSYRNMNRIAEKVVAVMNDHELQTLILSNYENDAQTLTSDTESNLLKFKELMGVLNEQETRRWQAIKRTFTENLKMRGIDASDPVGQVVVQMRSFTDGLDAIRQAMADGLHYLSEQANDSAADERVAEIAEQLAGLENGLEQIGGTLADGLKHLAEAGAVASRPSEVAGGFTPETIKALAQELRALGPAVAGYDATLPEQRVNVMHRVPRNLLDVLRNQFRLMEDWMKPLLSASETQRTELEQLRRTLEETLQTYSVLLAALDAAAAKKGDLPDESKQ
jgi:hypothetical protein